jgi:hypothetical protein
MELYWNWINNDTAIRIAWSLPGSAYIGLGLGGSMTGADIWIGYVNNDGSFAVHDHYAVTTGVPGVDTNFVGGTNDLTDLWATRSNGRTTVWFTRLLNTGDSFDTVITKNTVTTFIYAWSNGNPGALTYHGNSKTIISVDMTGC